MISLRADDKNRQGLICDTLVNQSPMCNQDFDFIGTIIILRTDNDIVNYAMENQSGRFETLVMLS